MAALLLGGVYGCSNDHSLACEPTARYASAASTGPVQIPDDLSPPDETESLRLPPVDAAKPPPGTCLEAPPGFYANGAPGATRTVTGTAPTQSKRRGRGRAPTAEAPPPATETAEKPSDKPAESSDREIGN